MAPPEADVIDSQAQKELAECIERRMFEGPISSLGGFAQSFVGSLFGSQPRMHAGLRHGLWHSSRGSDTFEKGAEARNGEVPAH